MIKKISLIIIMLLLVFVGTALAEDETVQCNPEILSCETLTPTPEPTNPPVTEWCSEKKCYIIVDSGYYLMDESQEIQPYFDEGHLEEILKENIEPIAYEIDNLYTSINELKRELGAQVEKKKPILNKNNILYGVIGLLSLLTLIFGIKALKKKK